MKKLLAVFVLVVFGLCGQARGEIIQSAVKLNCISEISYFDLRVNYLSITSLYTEEKNDFLLEENQTSNSFLLKKYGLIFNSTKNQKPISYECKFSDGALLKLQVVIKNMPISCHGGSYPTGFLKMWYKRKHEGKEWNTLVYDGELIDDCSVYKTLKSITVDGVSIHITGETGDFPPKEIYEHIYIIDVLKPDFIPRNIMNMQEDDRYQPSEEDCKKLNDKIELDKIYKKYQERIFSN